MGANAQTSVPVFTAGQVLTAQQQTEINTGVPVFATTVTRDAAFGGSGEKTLAEGQLAYIEASDVVQYYDGTSWATLAPTTSGVVQVKSATKSDTFSMASTTFADITDLSIAITPTSASNKVLVLATIGNSTTDGWSAQFRLMRDSTAIGLGAAAGSRTQTTVSDSGQTNASVMRVASLVFLDSPATTSATTYKVQAAQQDSTTPTVFINRSPDDTNAASRARTISTITVMEVAP